MSSPLYDLADCGQSAWIDYLARPFVRDGDLMRLIDDGVTGLTSNPTIFQSAIADGDAYDEQLHEVLAHEHDPKEVFLALARRDVQAACDLLADVFHSDAPAQDGWVSLEVDPNLAYDADATVREARHVHATVQRPNLFVKIPGTEPGIAAIEETIAAGIPVNVTLLFSLERHRAAGRAYLRGLRRLRDRGGNLGTVASVASFFVSRVDTEADRRLDAVDGPADLRSTLAIANAKLAYRSYRELFSGPEWDELAQDGASPQRCLWASTSTKDPMLDDLYYVERLIGPETVDTMPPATLEAFLDHGRAPSTLEDDLVDAQRTFERFADAGVDYDDVVATLERDGVDRFATSFRALLDGVAAKREELVG